MKTHLKDKGKEKLLEEIQHRYTKITVLKALDLRIEKK